jgi:hypothetical protein
MRKILFRVKAHDWFILQAWIFPMHCARCCGNHGTNFPSINKGMQDSGLGAVEFPVRIAVIAPIVGVDNINQNVKVAPVDGRKG